MPAPVVLDDAANFFEAGLGDQRVFGLGGRDHLFGDLEKTSGDFLGGDDELRGDAGDDELFGDARQAIVFGTFIGGNDSLDGGSADGEGDFLVGDVWRFEGEGTFLFGDDELRGREGNDVLRGDFDVGIDVSLSSLEFGDDELRRDSGNDQLFGEGFALTLVESDAEGGDDQLRGDAGDDLLVGDVKSLSMFDSKYELG